MHEKTGTTVIGTNVDDDAADTFVWDWRKVGVLPSCLPSPCFAKDKKEKTILPKAVFGEKINRGQSLFTHTGHTLSSLCQMSVDLLQI